MAYKKTIANKTWDFNISSFWIFSQRLAWCRNLPIYLVKQYTFSDCLLFFIFKNGDFILFNLKIFSFIHIILVCLTNTFCCVVLCIFSWILSIWWNVHGYQMYFLFIVVKWTSHFYFSSTFIKWFSEKCKPYVLV